MSRSLTSNGSFTGTIRKPIQNIICMHPSQVSIEFHLTEDHRLEGQRQRRADDHDGRSVAHGWNDSSVK